MSLYRVSLEYVRNCAAMSARMNIPECKTWKCGRYTVHATVRLGNPAFARYVVMRSGKVVGYSFSMPDKGWCEFIERMSQQGPYADSGPIKRYDYRLRGRAAARSGRPTNAARAQAAADLLKIPDDA